MAKPTVQEFLTFLQRKGFNAQISYESTYSNYISATYDDSTFKFVHFKSSGNVRENSAEIKYSNFERDIIKSFKTSF